MFLNCVLSDMASNASVTDSAEPWNISRLQNKNKSGLDDESVVVMITILVVVVLTLCAIIIVIAFKRSRCKSTHCANSKLSLWLKGSNYMAYFLLVAEMHNDLWPIYVLTFIWLQCSEICGLHTSS